MSITHKQQRFEKHVVKYLIELDVSVSIYGIKYIATISGSSYAKRKKSNIMLIYTHKVCQQLQEMITQTVIICWAGRMEIRFPPLYFLDESHSYTHTTAQWVMDNMRIVVGH